MAAALDRMFDEGHGVAVLGLALDVQRQAVTDGVLDEGHAEAVSQLSQTSVSLAPWLTTTSAQTELADEDNENDEYHRPVPIVDVWAEYHRLARAEGWTQDRIARAKGVNAETAGLRVRLHDGLPDAAKAATQDGILDEGHCAAVLGVTQDVLELRPWLTTTAQAVGCDQ